MTEKSAHIGRCIQLIKKRKISCFLIVIAILFAVLLMYDPVTSTDVQNTAQDEIDTESYESYLTEQISMMVSAITKEEMPHVTVTLRTTGETVYATENRTSERNSQEYADTELNKILSDGDSESTYIIVKNANGSQQPLIVTQIKPEIQGVVIVSRYGSNAAVCEKITLAVKTALNLSSTQVCVVGGLEYT